ncbi:MAG TPA: hypothetical protein VHB77_18720 [Planctomycetaceae bacterium]|nr:hypothetical protein [Planctomycetaceae bacterium]
MEVEQNSRKSSWTGIWCAAALAVLMVGYPLSVGPFAWLLHHGYLSREWEQPALITVYAPINWAYENIEWYNRAHQWYLSLWGL